MVFGLLTVVGFLVDCGAQVSLVRPRQVDLGRAGVRVRLRAANGTPIETFGARFCKIKIGKKYYKWKFIIANVEQNILGLDFRRGNGFIIDFATATIMQPEHNVVQALQPVSVPASTAGISPVIPEEDTLKKILHDEYSDLTVPDFKAQAKHNVQHVIETRGRPLHCRPRRLTPEKEKIAREEFSSCSAWAWSSAARASGRVRCIWCRSLITSGGPVETTGVSTT